MATKLWRMYADHLFYKWEKTVLWDMIEPYRRPKSFTPLVSIYIAAFYSGVIGSAITEQLYKEKHWEEHPGEYVPIMRPKFYWGPWKIYGGEELPPHMSNQFDYSCNYTSMLMERESREQRGTPLGAAPPEPPDFPLQWGGRKRLRRVKVRGNQSAPKPDGRKRSASRIGRRVVAGGEKEFSSPPHHYAAAQIPHRRSESAGSENQKSMSMSLEKDDRCYTTRASVAPGCEGENVASGGGGVVIDERASTALPRFFVSLSNKEKEEDFMAMKGCKLPQRPKKRSKLIQKCILLVSPGAWLSDLSQERYVVREKKGSRKRRRGLKAMSLESDSE
ncbi:hypothetical protein Cni_G28150 [Canna indica]|uniref:Embryo defective protein n=1 Tax=Canna indica TaxID=4628 RepID=A0AAQ3L910_9LILI|nr:hypothetical protein Cni_G28150 [Canna indica]